MVRQICFVLFLLYTGMNVYAQDKDSSSAISQPSAVSASAPAAGIFKTSGWSVNVYAGRFDAAYEPQFVGIRNKYGLGVGVSGEFAQVPYLGLDMELMFANRDYDTPIGSPLWGTIDNDTRVETSALLFGARAFYPASGPLRGYVSAGLGYFKTRMVVSGTLIGFPGIYEDTDTDIAPYYGLGVAYGFGRWGLSLDLRHFELKGNFSAFNISDANLGGDLLLVGWFYRF
ncbi:MAG: hypothetical protein P8Z75_03200 [Gammaproteobacteria bacterium]|jgi:hypothetical protein